MIKKATFIFLVFLFGASCSSFVKETEQPLLRELESGIYILHEDVEMSGVLLKKNQEIRLVVNGGDDWIKVYGYPANEDKLRAPRVLIIYLFPEDFKDELFDMDVFREKLAAMASLKTEEVPGKKADNTAKTKKTQTLRKKTK
ncbi:MAG: hypothetical protein CVV44_14995 [Spirochaetae bacterium HGW-Spirochaetae-1]|jgi:type II secretion system-associated lipoprotein|nr:MAG: hypothetical protein CVV44_14995 [Spirochaetae bacterium HGW-Spirochaetae-1]